MLRKQMDMEKRTEVKTIKVELVCDSCREGTMKPFLLRGGLALETSPSQYPHECTKCDAIIHIAGQVYPYMVHE
ncbi:hypothetical protein LCGC14_0844630 [marine sediment metagenome]|uniref:Uncharacterized protein n=1 Tax=marine sediment metagenome TaxID=412755 RepID=A0A0F9PGW9_9ZZZZ